MPEGCLYVRATDGKKKYCTIVLHKDLVKFQVNYAVLCKDKMNGLKRKIKGTETEVNEKKTKKKKENQKL